MLTEIVDRLVYDDLTNEELINLFHILINLSQSDVRTARAIVNQGALTTIINSSKNNRSVSPRLRTSCRIRLRNVLLDDEFLISTPCLLL